jgi:hypothetical protein
MKGSSLLTRKILSQTSIFLWHTEKNETAQIQGPLVSFQWFKYIAAEFTQEMEFLIINLTKDSRLFLHATYGIQSPFY